MTTTSGSLQFNILDIADVPFGFNERVEFQDNLRDNFQAVDTALTGLSTTEDVTYWVDPTEGSDTNAGTEAAPFQTIQKVVDITPKKIRHRIFVNLAAGNYTGFKISGFSFEPNEGSFASGFVFLGTFTASTLSTGAQTGSWTTVTQGSLTTGVFATLIDSTQAWTTNELQGKFVRVLNSSTGEFQIRPIISNTETSLVIPLVSTTINTTTTKTYEILDPGSVVTGVQPMSSFQTTAGGSTFSNGSAGIYIVGNMGEPGTTGILFEAMKVSTPHGPTNYPVRIGGTNTVVNFVRSSIASTTIQPLVTALNSPASILFSNCYFTSGGQASFYVLDATSTTPVNERQGGVIRMSSCVMAAMGGHALDVANAVLTNCHIETAIGVNAIGPGRIHFSTSALTRIINGSSQGIRARWENEHSGGSNIYLATGGTIYIAGTGGAPTRKAVEISGQHIARFDGRLLFDTCLAGLNAKVGARIAIANTCSGSNTTNNEEILIDGDGYTLATLRGLATASLSSNYGSYVHQ